MELAADCAELLSVDLCYFVSKLFLGILYTIWTLEDFEINKGDTLEGTHQITDYCPRFQ